jgi:hypothetical protein
MNKRFQHAPSADLLHHATNISASPPRRSSRKSKRPILNCCFLLLLLVQSRPTVAFQPAATKKLTTSNFSTIKRSLPKSSTSLFQSKKETEEASAPSSPRKRRTVPSSSPAAKRRTSSSRNTNTGSKQPNVSSTRNNYNNNRNQSSFNLQSKQLNQQLVQCQSAQDVLQILASQKGALTTFGGGGTLNSVNFSTSIHRIARHLNSHHHSQNANKNNYKQQQQQHPDHRYNRAVVLSDPRFALLLCSIAEALAGTASKTTKKKQTAVLFGSREMSNIAWALAKMKIVPPQTALASLLKDDTSGDQQQKQKEQHVTEETLLNTALQVREQVLQVAKARQEGKKETKNGAQAVWVPTLSMLCGYILDTIAMRATSHSSSMESTAFQERANLLWALATAQRATDQVYNVIMNDMIDDMQSLLQQQKEKKGESNKEHDNDINKRRRGKGSSSSLQPQEWSNSIWAFATAQIYGTGQERLLDLWQTC